MPQSVLLTPEERLTSEADKKWRTGNQCVLGRSRGVEKEEGNLSQDTLSDLNLFDRSLRNYVKGEGHG